MHRTLFAGALVALSLFGDSYLYAVLPVYYADAGVSLTAVGLLLSVNRWIRFFTNPLAGVVGPRVGWGWAFAGVMWLAAATTAGYGLLTGVGALLIVRALWGFCWSFLRIGGTAAVLADSPTGRRGKLMGIFSGVGRVGSVVGTAIGGFLADKIGFATTALVFAGATAAGAIVASLPPALAGRWGAPGREESRAAAPASVTWLPDTAPQTAACLSIATLHFVVSGLVTGTLGLLIKERLGAASAATVTGLILGARFALDLAIGPVLGHWADKRGRGVALGAATLALVGALLTLSVAASTPLISAAAVVLFAAGTGSTVMLDSWAGDLAGRSPGRFVPVYNTWLDLGAAAGPLLGYPLAARLGLDATYWLGAGALLLAWAGRAWLGRRSVTA